MKLILARCLIGVVLLANLQCTVVFIIWPASYAGGFELQGAMGAAMLRGMGVLFLMWNVPYAVALWNPMRYRVALYEALAMQTIGVVGETVIYATLPVVYNVARGSIARFIVFDAFGLLMLLGALGITRGLSVVKYPNHY